MLPETAKKFSVGVDEGTTEIFKDSFNEITKFGFVPKGISLEIAQKIVCNSGRFNSLINGLNRFLTPTLDTNSNLFCFVTGKINNARFIGPLLGGIALGLFCLFAMGIDITTETLLSLLALGLIGPLGILNIGLIGSQQQVGHEHYYYPSEGWIYSIGLQGKKIGQELFMGTWVMFMGLA